MGGVPLSDKLDPNEPHSRHPLLAKGRSSAVTFPLSIGFIFIHSLWLKLSFGLPALLATSRDSIWCWPCRRLLIAGDKSIIAKGSFLMKLFLFSAHKGVDCGGFSGIIWIKFSHFAAKKLQKYLFNLRRHFSASFFIYLRIIKYFFAQLPWLANILTFFPLFAMEVHFLMILCVSGSRGRRFKGRIWYKKYKKLAKGLNRFRRHSFHLHLPPPCGCENSWKVQVLKCSSAADALKTGFGFCFLVFCLQGGG